MKLCRIGDVGQERLCIVDAMGVGRDISSLVSPSPFDYLSQAFLHNLRGLCPSDFPEVTGNKRFGPCLDRVGNFIAVGLNYSDHAAETGAVVPEEPVLFNKASTCLIGPDDDVVIPQGSTKTDWEVELAVVIGTAAYRITEADAAEVIAGYCICNDISERAFQLERGGQWTKGKGCPTFGPLGPWLVTPDEIGEVQNLPMWLKVNGKLEQQSSTKNMVFGVHFLVSYISQFMLLQPGDVITTGTPAGVGMGKKPQRFLRPGDVMEVGIEGLGIQRQSVVSADALVQ